MHALFPTNTDGADARDDISMDPAGITGLRVAASDGNALP